MRRLLWRSALAEKPHPPVTNDVTHHLSKSSARTKGRRSRRVVHHATLATSARPFPDYGQEVVEGKEHPDPLASPQGSRERGLRQPLEYEVWNDSRTRALHGSGEPLGISPRPDSPWGLVMIEGLACQKFAECSNRPPEYAGLERRERAASPVGGRFIGVDKRQLSGE